MCGACSGSQHLCPHCPGWHYCTWAEPTGRRGSLHSLSSIMHVAPTTLKPQALLSNTKERRSTSASRECGLTICLVPGSVLCEDSWIFPSSLQSWILHTSTPRRVGERPAPGLRPESKLTDSRPHMLSVKRCFLFLAMCTDCQVASSVSQCWAFLFLGSIEGAVQI